MKKKPKSIDPYFKQLSRHKVLSREDELKLFKEYHAGSKLAKNKLAQANLRYVVKRAHGHSGYINYKGITFADLVQEGNIGLIKAIEKFDPTRGFKLVSYAGYWINYFIRNYIIKNSGIIKTGTTAGSRILFWKRGEVIDALRKSNNQDELIVIKKKLAKKYNVSLRDIELDYLRMSTNDFSIDAPMQDEDVTNLTLHDFIGKPGDQNNTVEFAELSETIADIFSNAGLSDRQKSIIYRRFFNRDGEVEKFDDIGNEYGISRERVRQIQVQALNKMKTYLNKIGKDFNSLVVAA